MNHSIDQKKKYVFQRCRSQNNASMETFLFDFSYGQIHLDRAYIHVQILIPHRQQQQQQQTKTIYQWQNGQSMKFDSMISTNVLASKYAFSFHLIFVPIFFVRFSITLLVLHTFTSAYMHARKTISVCLCACAHARLNSLHSFFLLVICNFWLCACACKVWPHKI